MFRGLPTASLPLVKLFDTPYLFTVPAYQRPYSWTIKEAGQLFEDLMSSAGIDDSDAAGPDYFLGTILLLDPEADGAIPQAPLSVPRVYEVVDGQQRLVTLSILASVLRDADDEQANLRDDGVSIADRLHSMVAVVSSERDIATRSGRVQVRDAEQNFLENHVLARGPRPALQPDPQAAGTASAGINAVRDFLALEVAALTPADRRTLGLYLMNWCHVVVIVSRDIDRAHRLFTVLNERGKPLERNDIIKAEVLRGMPASSATAALAMWDEAHAATAGDFETFLGHLKLIHGLHRPPIIAAVRSLVRELGSEKFIEQELRPYTNAFNRVRTFPQRPESQAHRELSGALVSLNRLGKADWVPAAILAMAQFDASPGAATHLIQEIERLAYLLRLLGYGSGKRQRRFAPVVEAIRTHAAASQLARTLEITREEQRTIAFHLKDLHKRNAAMCKLLLMRLEEELAGVPLAVEPKYLTIEHVLPCRPAATSSWKSDFVDAEERADCQASLGNLALVTEKQNDRAKNKDFAEKLAIYREPQAGIPALLTNADILSATSWLPADIRAREARLLEVMARIWRIDVGSASSSVVRMFG
ncbi:MAG: DUF262 domain-containing HNH endonuclease family protein [Hyphomicrobiaceae bacterium]